MSSFRLGGLARSTGRECLSPLDCGDPRLLSAFVQDHISPNAWPIHSPALLKAIHERGLSLADAADFAPTFDDLAAILPDLHDRSLRVTRRLGIKNEFHTTIHNYEVLLRLLVLEWPTERKLPEHVEQAPMRTYVSYEEIEPVLLRVLDALLAVGRTPPELARDIIAALGHDYGHTGGTDRLDDDGEPCPLTHEETSERHVARLGLDHGFPPALILESLAGIRATTFFSRPGRERIEARTEFERHLMLADVMGCVLPADQWLVHVGLPVFAEKLPLWKCRLKQIPGEREELTAKLAAMTTLPDDDPAKAAALQSMDVIERESRLIIQDLAEWFRSERGFFLFIEGQRLKAVPHAIPLWGGILKDRIHLMERILARQDLLAPLSAGGLPFLEAMAARLSNVPALREAIEADGFDPRLKEILKLFLPPA